VPVHAARLAPLRPETTWRLDGDILIETTGKSERRWPLASARSLTLAPPGPGGRCAAWLAFPRGRATLVSHSWSGPGRFEDRSDSFGPFVRALAARLAEVAPGARVAAAGQSGLGGVTWTIGLLGAGVAALLVFSLLSDTAGLGVSLAARLLFALIMIFAVTPWLRPPPPALDPRDLPRSLTP
jgi:hypothetical protein